jgi:hypothetical protein
MNKGSVANSVQYSCFSKAYALFTLVPSVGESTNVIL